MELVTGSGRKSLAQFDRVAGRHSQRSLRIVGIIRSDTVGPPRLSLAAPEGGLAAILRNRLERSRNSACRNSLVDHDSANNYGYQSRRLDIGAAEASFGSLRFGSHA